MDLSELTAVTAPQLVPYPDTVYLKAAKGAFHHQLKRLPQYCNRRARIGFCGTVKIHGTNLSIVFTSSSLPQVQSRTRVITPETDNGYGAAAWLSPHLQMIHSTINTIVGREYTELMVAGEFAGKGINPEQAATSALEKFYAIFAIRIDGIWLDRKAWHYIRFSPSARIFNIYEFKTFSVVINFNEERTVGGGKMVSELSLEVENECPVALQLGEIKGGLGEGIVWTEERDEKHWSTNPMRFKSKGPKFETVGKTAPSEEEASAGKSPHGSPLASSLACPGAVSSSQSTSLVSTMLPIQPSSDPSSNVDIQGTAEQFVQYAVTKARIDQGLENIREELGRGRESEVDMSEVLRDKANINKLSQWLMKDVIKEEGNEMKKLALSKGPGKSFAQIIITRRVKELFQA